MIVAPQICRRIALKWFRSIVDVFQLFKHVHILHSQNVTHHRVRAIDCQLPNRSITYSGACDWLGDILDFVPNFLEFFCQVVLRVPRWEIICLRTDGIAVRFVELSGLEIEGVQPCESATQRSPQFLGPFQELVPESLATQIVRNPQDAYLQPVPNGVACNPANSVAYVVAESDAKLAIVSWLSELVRELDQFSPDVFGFALRHVVVKAVFHTRDPIRFVLKVNYFG
jgi:hypothetical protein